MPTSVRKSKLVRAVRVRDRDICQCCYTCSEDSKIEVHHIEPLCFGGADVVENMVCLCSRCHKGAPNNPFVFLQYQKQRGSRGAEILGRLMSQPPSAFGCSNHAEVILQFEMMMHDTFKFAWDGW